MFDKIYNFFYRVYRILGRTIICYSFNSRPSSPPYFTGDGLRNFADFIYDSNVKNVVPEKIKERDIILECNGEKLTMDKTIQDFLEKLKVGDILNMKVLRDEKELEIKVVLAERK